MSMNSDGFSEREIVTGLNIWSSVLQVYHISPTDHCEMSFLTLCNYLFLSPSLQTELQASIDCTSQLVRDSCDTFHI